MGRQSVHGLPSFLVGGNAMVLATVATDLHQLGQALAADLIGWGAAVIGIALTASAVIWVLRLIRA
jgi:hypothetical protein